MLMQASRYLGFSLLTVLILFVVPIQGDGQTIERGMESENVTGLSVKSLAENPEKYLGKTVRVTGRLENIGRNYFTDLRVIIKDGEGNFVYVRPWLPAELRPSPPGYAGEKRPVLSQYLGKEVELIGILERGTLKKVGEVYLLTVKSAKVLK